MGIRRRHQKGWCLVVIVYLLLNQVNGKGYVGQHKGDTLSKRWNSNLNNCKTNTHLQAAIKKYGPKSFTRTVLAHASCQEELDLLEKFHITIFQTCDPRYGYNLQTGGLRGTGRHLPETRQRIGEAVRRRWKGKTPAEMARHAEMARQSATLMWEKKTKAQRQEFGQKVRKALQGRKTGKPAWNWGLIPGPTRGMPRAGHTAETKQRISDGLKKYYEEKRRLPPKKPSIGTNGRNDSLNRKNVVAADELMAIAEARRELKKMVERLDKLEFEYMGGCLW